MRISLAAIAASLAIAATAYAQAPTTPAATDPATAAPAAVPVPSTKRFACHNASQGLQGQERRDQMQLCMAQARIDCLKQAIEQKIVGAQRKEFVESCVE
jgi:hypothetical protein